MKNKTSKFKISSIIIWFFLTIGFLCGCALLLSAFFFALSYGLLGLVWLYHEHFKGLVIGVGIIGLLFWIFIWLIFINEKFNSKVEKLL